MDAPNMSLSELVDLVKSWLPWKSEPTNVSRVFWMPDHSCAVCYDCDSQFTLLNRRHHCRLCGRIFCSKCTSNSVSTPSTDPRPAWDNLEKIRVCNYCFRQWENGITTSDNGVQVFNQDLTASPSAASLASTKSSSTANRSYFTVASVPCSLESCQQGQQCSSLTPYQSLPLETSSDRQSEVKAGMSTDFVADMEDPSLAQYGFSIHRSDVEDDDYGSYHYDSETRNLPQVKGYYDQVDFDEMSNHDGLHKLQINGEYVDTKSSSGFPLHNSFDSLGVKERPQLGKKDECENCDEAEVPSSLCDGENVNTEPVDFENSGPLWLPPEPADEEDEREANTFDDDDDIEGNAAGEWGYSRTPTPSSFGSGEYHIKDQSIEEHKKAMKTVVDGHFRALVAQLLQVENLPVDNDDEKQSWLEIITLLSWEAATLLKPDMSKGGGMDPGGYVKVKCIASGQRCESMIVKGVVCKKNVAHRRMTSKIEKPRLLILGGALEYQRVSNLLSSFDTLLQQEMDHLKMAVAKIHAHRPDVLLVEKSVSRYAQEYLLEKDISLVLNIKRTLLERIARCTGAQIVPSIDHLSSQKLGYCEKFHVEKFLEDLGTSGKGGKKSMKTLMYFEGCPKPLGCTIFLRGASSDELKKVKHVVQYGVFAAYHLALETSFLADEGASLPELPMNSLIIMGLPNKLSSIERSISTVTGFSFTADGNTHEPQPSDKPQRSHSVPSSCLAPSVSSDSVHKVNIKFPASFSATGESVISDSQCNELVPSHTLEKDEMHSGEYLLADTFSANNGPAVLVDDTVNVLGPLQTCGQGGLADGSEKYHYTMDTTQVTNSDISSKQHTGKYHLEEPPLKEEFPPSPSDHQSILVSLSSRCVWTGTVCERSHLSRIKYYGSFDKPLGRFLRDHLFDQSYHCGSCEMPSEAHVHCYTHHQGTLTISVKRVSEILLPGEREGKIWMWHRCLRCPRTNGFPPATRRVAMSDAAWGLSFGKFLELSFSNHAAASRVASCGHSLHRDCLRFYGFGEMVACFRYASIDVLSVYLPPSKLDFDFENQEWIQKEADEVVNQAELLFSEVLNTLRQIVENRAGMWPLYSSMRTSELKRVTEEMEALLQMEKQDFEVSLGKTLKRRVEKGHPVIDILEINRLRRQLLFQSFMWDHRLTYAASSVNNTLQDGLGDSVSSSDKKLIPNTEKLTEMNEATRPVNGFSSCDSLLVDVKLGKSPELEEGFGSNVNLSGLINQEADMDGMEDYANLSASLYIGDQADDAKSKTVHRTLSEGKVPVMENISQTLDAAWTGEAHPGITMLTDTAVWAPDSMLADSSTEAVAVEEIDAECHTEDQRSSQVSRPLSPILAIKSPDDVEDSVNWLRMPFMNFYRSLNKNYLRNAQNLDNMECSPLYISCFSKLELRNGARLLLPMSINDTIIPVYDDEPTSIISYALLSPEYYEQQTDEGKNIKDDGDSTSSLISPDPMNLQNSHLGDETMSESHRSHASADDSNPSLFRSRSSMILDPLSYTKALHVKVSFEDDGPLGKVKYTVTCYYAKRFEALRRMCCPSELDFIRSLSRCKKWKAQGGKSNVFFAKTLDDRFIIKQVTKTELESFIQFGPEYFKYLSESIGTRSPTCLAKILGIYQVNSKHLKGGKESKMDVLVIENLLYRRNVTRLYDLKGSSRSRYNPDSSGSNKVLLDQNLIEAMSTSPIFVGNKAKRLLERAVWNDTSFLASVDVMDYSLLVGVDEEKHELVLGIIDFMREYTWDKHLETWVKTSGILGGPKNSSPTVISPKQYKKRFRKAMTAYFLMVPDQWSPPIAPSKSCTDISEESTQGGTSVQ
ncbi:hypothetical protein HS088_TW18G00772 [Tripterygium wilfordii]|uniref:1-phosphatidylinositol-3-phosphate 5-kinase n=1 Tax=Tripterygium wilfordii TaxID=458696 RepID=A0A7J7CD80_TRIWF|nr:1-phosphatidylinositol-3-phosphate 5-kinase FAB1B-like [Tripterygium wilfordii]XP_038684287.1 1-phosphatidylinositol-3-phosphate 5-kinase FAB1B-like [Tripterygium wilfordii]XP_038684288.1 1-phosphatidylinositol-3-phosphate 5-kinase FAB1B-like [Tripterygium wilfordii]XP_038684289.1 1-phosphatidylinositol-3-phosphate 5-kinase FAB1B-like [Tripterygium wilfordii]XP_038684290.1 1-phosphatidylinositol-3-phosphate 5-kinase FAB1B-like [Tripterygium wilfordii]KAF5732083.1 hypothetical protein HS088_